MMQFGNRLENGSTPLKLTSFRNLEVEPELQTMPPGVAIIGLYCG